MLFHSPLHLVTLLHSSPFANSPSLCPSVALTWSLSNHCTENIMDSIVLCNVFYVTAVIQNIKNIKTQQIMRKKVLKWTSGNWNRHVLFFVWSAYSVEQCWETVQILFRGFLSVLCDTLPPPLFGLLIWLLWLTLLGICYTTGRKSQNNRPGYQSAQWGVPWLDKLTKLVFSKSLNPAWFPLPATFGALSA